MSRCCVTVLPSGPSPWPAWRRGRFPTVSSQLLKTFADQAVIAIENVRLFTELEGKNHDLTETLEQQTATGEILRVISSSPTDVQPVFDTIAVSALRLCDAKWSAVTRFDGHLIELAAHHGLTDPAGIAAVERAFPRKPSLHGATDRAIMGRVVGHYPDVLEDRDYQFQDMARAAGYRSMLAVPMVREGQAVGAITVAGATARTFSDRQIELLKTFADQAVIAIENVRLFTGARGAQSRPHRDARAADRDRRDPARHLPAHRPTSSRSSTRSPGVRSGSAMPSSASSFDSTARCSTSSPTMA